MKNQLYYCLHEEKPLKTKFYQFLGVNKKNQLHIDYATTSITDETQKFTKEQWKEFLKGTAIELNEVKFIKAPENGVSQVYYEPSKCEGTLNLSEIKREFKKRDIKIINILSRKYYVRYLPKKKQYYEISFNNNDKEKVEKMIFTLKNIADIGFKNPSNI